MILVLDEPLLPSRAKALILSIMATGGISPSGHGLDEMKKDTMDNKDVENVLRGGVVDPAELVNGTWRYRVRTQRMTVVIAFRSETRLSIVTAWRNKP